MVEIKDGYAHYECGCKFEVTQNGPPIRLRVDPRIETLPKDCSRTWNLFATGNTKGVFQLETRFGQQYSKKLMPENIEQLAALMAILRPGCTQSYRGSKNIAEHYIDRKNGVEKVEQFHEALAPILVGTFGEMIYQEQAMQIAQLIAGFTLQQADVLRKAIGKKKADVMAEVKIEFIAGCKSVGIVTKEEAEEIFGWIEKSQRYSFNKSHAICYAFNAYQTAYFKAHFPVAFFTSYLWYAKDKSKKFDEIKLLIANTNQMGIKVLPPDFNSDNSRFKRVYDKISDNYNDYDDSIYFGFGDIKSVGENRVKKMSNAIYIAETSLDKHRSKWTWIEFLVHFSQQVDSTIMKGIIEAGALSHFKIARTKMLFDYEQYSVLTKKEQAWIKQNLTADNIIELLEKAVAPYSKGGKKINGPCNNYKRVQKLKDIIVLAKDPPYSMEDSTDWIARIEEARLGVSITASVLDSCKDLDQANCTILEFNKQQEKSSGIFIACQIEEIRTHITKTKQEEMAFVTVNDQEDSLSCVVFPKDWPEIKACGACVTENTVIISGDRSKNKDSFIIKKMWQLT